MRFADDQKASSESAVESRSGSSKQMEEAEARPGGYARTHQSGCRAPTSAAFGRFHAPRTAQVPRIRPFRPFYPLRTRWRPMNPLSPCSHSCLRSPRRRHRHPQRTDAHGTQARTHNLHPTALWRRLLRRLLLHRSSPPRRPRSSLPRRSGRCLPATAPTRRMRTRPLDRCIDPAAVCSAAMPKWLRMPAKLTALRRKTRGACMPPSARPLDETAREPEVCRTSSRA